MTDKTSDSTEPDDDVLHIPTEEDLGDPFVGTDDEHYRLDCRFIELPLRLKRFLIAYSEWHNEVVG